MSSLFRVRVEEVKEKSCILRLYIIHPDQNRFYASTSFALQLLWDPTHPAYGIDTELGRAISVAEIGNVKFVLKNQDRFIRSVKFVDLKNYPVAAKFNHMTKDELEAYWANEEGLPQAVIQIKVSDHKWLSHLRVGMEWETAAYNM